MRDSFKLLPGVLPGPFIALVFIACVQEGPSGHTCVRSEARSVPLPEESGDFKRAVLVTHPMQTPAEPNPLPLKSCAVFPEKMSKDGSVWLWTSRDCLPSPLKEDSTLLIRGKGGLLSVPVTLSWGALLRQAFALGEELADLGARDQLIELFREKLSVADWSDLARSEERLYPTMCTMDRGGAAFCASLTDLIGFEAKWVGSPPAEVLESIGRPGAATAGLPWRTAQARLQSAYQELSFARAFDLLDSCLTHENAVCAHRVKVEALLGGWKPRDRVAGTSALAASAMEFLQAHADVKANLSSYFASRATGESPLEFVGIVDGRTNAVFDNFSEKDLAQIHGKLELQIEGNTLVGRWPESRNHMPELSGGFFGMRNGDSIDPLAMVSAETAMGDKTGDDLAGAALCR